MACTCIPNATFCSGSFDLSGTINSLSGQLTIGCKPDGTCSFSQSFLNKLFGAQGLAMSDCTFGECVRQYVIDQALGLVGDSTGGNGLSGGIIAGLAVVGALLALTLAAFLFGYMRQRRARKRPLVENDDGLFGGGPKRGVGLAWSGVGYVVPDAKNAGVRARVVGAMGMRAKGTGAGKVVLDNVSGRLNPGGFCCILGPSGE
jgi:hypothetical protein